MIEHYREVEVGTSVVRWVRIPCMNPLCVIRTHRHGLVSTDGGPWVVGLYPPESCSEETAEAALVDLEELVQRQGIAFGCSEWGKVHVEEINRQLVTVEVLSSPAAEYLVQCPLESLRAMREKVKRGDMSRALELCGTFGVDVGGEDAKSER